MISPYVYPGLKLQYCLGSGIEKYSILGIIESVCRNNNYDIQALLSKNRKLELVSKRVIIMKLLRENGFTYTAIGKAFDRDHSTVLHSINVIFEQLKNNDKFISEFEKFKYLFKIAKSGKTTNPRNV